MGAKTVYLLRGLPSSGKSHLARRLVGDEGVLLETDAYFEAVPANQYQDRARNEVLEMARQWNFERFQKATADGATPIAVDRGNGLTLDSYHYVRTAMDQGYQVELREPDSPWWQEIRVLLKYKEYTGPVLDVWATQLAEMNRTTHSVPEAEIRKLMEAWKFDLTVDEILEYGLRATSNPKDGESRPAT